MRHSRILYWLDQINAFSLSFRGPKVLICIALLIVFLSSCLYSLIKARPHLTNRGKTSSACSTPSPPSIAPSEKQPVAQAWTPSSFTRPKASPRPDFNIHTTPSQPYRPFRYGPKYNVTMGLRTMSWDDWIELDSDYLKYHAAKAARIAERGDQVCKTLPEAQDAAWELLEELRGFLTERYPMCFESTTTGIKNLVTSEEFDFSQAAATGTTDPMEIAGRLVSDDLAIMLPYPAGTAKTPSSAYLAAGSIVLPGFWRLSDKLGMSLDEIHTSGSVAQYAEKLQRGMNNFFARLKPDSPVCRHNYFIQTDDELGWSSSIGSEDLSEGAFGWHTAAQGTVIARHHFRSERQSLRRLPRSGAIVFTIRTYFLPVTALVKEPGVPGRLASAIRSWGEDVARYKGRERYGEVLLAYLDREHAEQVRLGVVGQGEVDEGSGYPFFARKEKARRVGGKA